MKKLFTFICASLMAGSLFAQTFDSKKLAVEGVISLQQNRKDVSYELTDYEVSNDLTYFTYTWMQETKILLSKTYTQYKCFLNITSSEENGAKKLVTNIENEIYFRSVNADGSEIRRTPNVKGVSYEWTKAAILNKKKILDSVSEQVEKDLIAELNKTDDELSKSLVAFFSDDVNITYFDADALGKLAMNYPMLCSVPSLVWKLNKDKSEIWFNKYKETVTDAKFDNTFEVHAVKESNIPEYKYLIECLAGFSYFLGDGFVDLMEGYKELMSESFGEFYSTKEFREKSYNRYKSNFSKSVLIKLYSNDDKFIDMNKGDKLEVKGILKAINTPGTLLKEITSISVYEE